jgi:tetratricopeptide (TPR) repeat protein
MEVKGATFGIVGALAAFPRRLAAREVLQQAGVLRRGVTRKTTHVVFGRSLLTRTPTAEIESRYDAVIAAGQTPLSEAGFLRLLKLASAPEASAMSAQSVLEQSRLPWREFEFLCLFDAFEHQTAPFSFRDVILAKKYAGLLASGAGWQAIAKAVLGSGELASLTALALHAEGGNAIYARQGDMLSELNGQGLLQLGEPDDVALEDLFATAEAADAGHEFAEAAALYRRCLAIDPSDSVAAFNMANCFKAAGDEEEAAHGYALALKLDPGFVEAWLNFAALLREQLKPDLARDHLIKALALDPQCANAIYNLGALEHDAGNLAEARAWWVRYLEFDQTSDWAKTASRGIQYADLYARRSAS